MTKKLIFASFPSNLTGGEKEISPADWTIHSGTVLAKSDITNAYIAGLTNSNFGSVIAVGWERLTAEGNYFFKYPIYIHIHICTTKI